MQLFTGRLRGTRRAILRFLVIFFALLLLMGCTTPSGQSPTASTSTDKTFHVPRRTDIPLTPEQEKVRQQATRAVEADIDGYLARYIEKMTAVYDKDGNVITPGTGDIVVAMTKGPLIISADDMRDLFPQYAASKAGRSIHSQSVHEAVTAMAAELYRRALAVDDPRGNNTVLFTAGGVASGKTTAIRTIDEIKRAAMAAQIIYDGTMRGYEKSLRRMNMALEAGKADIGLSNLSVTCSRAKEIKFTKTYRELGIVLLINRMKAASLQPFKVEGANDHIAMAVAVDNDHLLA